jgi:hypothetical protein
VSASTEAHFRVIEKRQGLSLPRERIEGFEPTEVAVPVDASGTGGVKGKRPSKKDKLRAAAQAAQQARRDPKRTTEATGQPTASSTWCRDPQVAQLHRAPAGARGAWHSRPARPGCRTCCRAPHRT